MRPIDADALIKKYGDWYVEEGTESGFIGTLKNLLATEPTAQPEPQEGHWIRRGCGLDIECKCSVCGYKDFVEPHDTYWFKRNYCPNCGARMKGATL